MPLQGHRSPWLSFPGLRDPLNATEQNWGANALSQVKDGPLSTLPALSFPKQPVAVV